MGGGAAPRILNFGTRWGERSASFCGCLALGDRFLSLRIITYLRRRLSGNVVRKGKQTSLVILVTKSHCNTWYTHKFVYVSFLVCLKHKILVFCYHYRTPLRKHKSLIKHWLCKGMAETSGTRSFQGTVFRTWTAALFRPINSLSVYKQMWNTESQRLYVGRQKMFECRPAFNMCHFIRILI